MHHLVTGRSSGLAKKIFPSHQRSGIERAFQFLERGILTLVFSLTEYRCQFLFFFFFFFSIELFTCTSNSLIHLVRVRFNNSKRKSPQSFFYFSLRIQSHVVKILFPFMFLKFSFAPFPLFGKNICSIPFF